jgi:hypothetical protein
MALGKRTSSFLKEGSLASGFAVGIVINSFLNILKLLEPKPIFKNNGGLK